MRSFHRRDIQCRHLLPVLWKEGKEVVKKAALRKFFSPRTWADVIFPYLIPGYYKEWQKRNPIKEEGFVRSGREAGDEVHHP